ncbi:MAG: hypothetical protein Q8P46_00350 [Hyphomicrobiales bacterium]|nr:hypothetical protein [Hyphomicrobiales bacterium]
MNLSPEFEALSQASLKRTAAMLKDLRAKNERLVPEINRLLEAGGSERRFTVNDLCVTDVLWALIPVLQRVVDEVRFHPAVVADVDFQGTRDSA